jgi:hypothetical protein
MRLAYTLPQSHTGFRVGQRVVRILRNQGGANVLLPLAYMAYNT